MRNHSSLNVTPFYENRASQRLRNAQTAANKNTKQRFRISCYTERKQNVPILKDPKIDRFATQKKGLVESKFQSLSFAQILRPLILVMSEGVHFDAPSHFLVPVEVPVEAPAEVPAEAPAAPVEDARRPVAVAVISAALAAVLRRPRNGSP